MFSKHFAVFCTFIFLSLPKKVFSKAKKWHETPGSENLESSPVSCLTSLEKKASSNVLKKIVP